jgi:DedD protein
VGADAVRRRQGTSQGWLVTLLGILVLVTGGFVLGLIVGIVSEEPELVVGHVAGRSTEIDWSVAEIEPDLTPLEPPRPSRVVLGESEPQAQVPAGAELPAVGSAPPSALLATSVGPESGRFAVQVGAFGDADAAGVVADKLRAGGYSVWVVAPGDDDRWRVRVGPTATRAEADAIAHRLKVEELLPTWVLRESGR